MRLKFDHVRASYQFNVERSQTIPAANNKLLSDHLPVSVYLRHDLTKTFRPDYSGWLGWPALSEPNVNPNNGPPFGSQELEGP